ncbi:MAG TPA: ATP-binding protein [Candidatus Hydrogenedentes bacterium]|nr:MAG: transposase/IS protein [Candidatus Hydrogenedentes bacterium ADurb.Bin101]HOC68182.1 ATP-binding protein [Candidatus Hydrogenedentota bacterium]HQN01946.1 ATP-binding protein [Candidatus Hydrogenedentota bacterium]
MLYPYTEQNTLKQREETGGAAEPPQQWYKVVAHTQKGSIYHGLCTSFEREANELEIFLHDKKGKPINKRKVIPFEKLKALFLIKQFEDYPVAEPANIPAPPPNAPLAVEFHDGEIIVARPMDTDWKNAKRLLLRPEDSSTNNLLLFAERTAIKSVSSLEVYKQEQAQAFNAFVRSHFKPGMSREECLGDYYFSRMDYWHAADFYSIALDHASSNARVKNKLCVSKYNIGMHHIKNKDYSQALQYMELVLELDPDNTWAREKANKLQEHLRMQAEIKAAKHQAPVIKDSSLMERFIEGHWVKHRQHFILTGPAHAGKTRLACSIGAKATKYSMNVMYYRVPQLIERILSQKKDGGDIQILRALEKTDFLILDDWKIEIFPDEEREEFLEIIADRYKRQATLIIAELPDNQWHQIFGTSTATNPKLNQVLYDALKVHLDKHGG